MTRGTGRDESCIDVRGLVVRFDGVPVVDGTEFSVPRGQVTALVGPNGAGKSTVLKAIGGLLKPAEGTITHRGNDITGLAPHEVARRGLIRTFQQTSEFSRLTVLENLLAGARQQRGGTFWGAMRGKRYWRRSQESVIARARELLRRFALSELEDQYAGELSGGQKRMVEIMRALMAEPDVLLLDEPLAGVNPTLARRVEDQLLALRADGVTMLMVEHELGAVERISDSVIMMAQGRVLARGSMEQLRANEEVIDAYVGR